MTNTNATNLRKNLFEYLNSAIDFNDVINVNTKKGNAVIISEAEYNSLVETLYLTSIPGMKDRLDEGIDATVDDCVNFEW
ncbi:type II toxin-antitoxin system Phd/YefM family antitoxin [Acetobacterium fimetarium]|uniref:Antitoxin n=1 Tax=Acetobacterium fimetarium TaxID=52691 RepID=A0ABR6WRU3_9FIRM|nr:type II toxin-antitoxin system Phd/YefM family antitoxin [Acetobacterium fimetarium]MBC3803343.1 type II toxin-antitoxin system Phd/YefM family antitoxin [Acetobacterium fimetarium]